jgi:hypothetical protein
MGQIAMQDRMEALDVSRSLTLLPNRRDEHRSGKGFQPHALADSAFVVQLLAVKLDAPIQRQRRREEPAVATYLYACQQGMTTADTLGPIFSSRA